jgi:hypothetical protein
MSAKKRQITHHVPTLEDQLRALDRGARIAMLGIGHLRWNISGHPRHRPKTVDSPLRRDEIAQAVAIIRVLHPEKPEKWIIGRIGDCYRVSRSYVYKILKEIDSERSGNIKASAPIIVEMWAEMGILRPEARERLK